MTTQSTWRYLMQLSRYGGRYSVAHAGLWGIMNLSALLPGLIAQRFFDALTGEATVAGGTNGLVLLLGALAVGQARERHYRPIPGSQQPGRQRGLRFDR